MKKSVVSVSAEGGGDEEDYPRLHEPLRSFISPGDFASFPSMWKVMSVNGDRKSAGSMEDGISISLAPCITKKSEKKKVVVVDLESVQTKIIITIWTVQIKWQI